MSMRKDPRRRALVGLAAASATAVCAVGATNAIAAATAPVQVTAWTPAYNGNWNGEKIAAAANPNTGHTLVVSYYQGINSSSERSYVTLLLGPEGTQVGSQHVLAKSTQVPQQQPAVAYDPTTGGWIACWGEQDPSANKPVKCRAIAADGTPAADTTTILSGPNNIESVTIAYSPAKKRFLVGASGGDWEAAIFVNSTGTPQGTSMDPFPGLTSYGAFSLTYSATSDTFLAQRRGKTTGSSEQDAPWTTLLNGDGVPVGTPRRLDPNTALGYYSASVTWNRTRNEFYVASFVYGPYPQPSYPMVVQRFSATDGARVGDLKSVEPAGWATSRYRPQILANPFADETLAHLGAQAQATNELGIYVGFIASDGTPPSTVELVQGGTSATKTTARPWSTFNPTTCEWLAVYGSRAGDGTTWQIWSSRYPSAAGCTSTLSLAKGGEGKGSIAGTAAETPAEVGLAEASASCDAACSSTTKTLYRTMTVSLTASPAAGSEFTGWSGACAGTGTCTVTMAQARSVTATFAPVSPDSLVTPLAAVSSRALPGNRTRTNFRLRYDKTGRFSFYMQNAAGKRIPLLRGSTVGTRVLRRTFFAPVVQNGRAGTSVTITAITKGKVPAGATLRAVLRNTDGSLRGQTISARP